MTAATDPVRDELASHEEILVARSPTDLLRLAVASAITLVLLLVGLLFDVEIVRATNDLTAGFAELPSWFVTAVGVGARGLALALIGIGLLHTVATRQLRPLATLAVASAVAAVLFVLIDPLLDARATSIAELEVDVTVVGHPEFPGALGLVFAAATVAAVGPWAARSWRRAGWALVLLLAVSRFLVAPLSFETTVGLLAGWVGGSAALVILGAPVRRPSGAQIAAGLSAVGVDLASMHKAGVDARGSTPYFATDTDGQALFVKALGSDERSADLLFRLYRRILPRRLGDERPFSSLRRAVEHEALVALAARDVGIRTPRLRAFANAADLGFVLAYEAIAGRSFDRLDPTEVSDETLAAVWQQLGELRAHGIAHRDLRLANIFLSDEGDVWMIDFGFSELAASDLLLATDVAELLASSSLQVGVERAVRVGVSVVGPDVVRSGLARLDTKYLSGATRAGIGDDPSVLDELRMAVGSLVVPAP